MKRLNFGSGQNGLKEWKLFFPLSACDEGLSSCWQLLPTSIVMLDSINVVAKGLVFPAKRAVQHIYQMQFFVEVAECVAGSFVQCDTYVLAACVAWCEWLRV